MLTRHQQQQHEFQRLLSSFQPKLLLLKLLGCQLTLLIQATSGYLRQNYLRYSCTLLPNSKLYLLLWPKLRIVSLRCWLRPDAELLNCRKRVQLQLQQWLYREQQFVQECSKDYRMQSVPLQPHSWLQCTEWRVRWGLPSQLTNHYLWYYWRHCKSLERLLLQYLLGQLAFMLLFNAIWAEQCLQ